MTNLRDRWSTRTLSTLLCVLLVLPSLAACTSALMATDQPPAAAAADPWPRQLTSGDHTFSLFQPQYERWEQGRLDGRAAVAVESQASPQPTYGVMSFSARTQIDKETRLVTLEDVTVSKADFPTAPDGGAGYLAALRQILAGQPLTIALDRLHSIGQTTTPSTSMTAPPASAATSVTGAWTGWAGEGAEEEPVTMNLKQTGASVSGDLIIGGRPDLSGPLTGSVQGNAIRLMLTSGYFTLPELTLKQDQIFGVVAGLPLSVRRAR